MKYSLIVKFLAVLLCAVSLVFAFAGGVGIVAMENSDLYVNDLSKLQGLEYESIAKTIAENYAKLYAAESLGNLPYLLKEAMYTDPTERSDSDHWFVQLQQDGTLLAQGGTAASDFAFVKEYKFVPLYPITYEESQDIPEDSSSPTDSTDPTPSEPEPQPPTDYLYRDTQTIWENGGLNSYDLYYYEAPEYTVTIAMQKDVLASSKLQILTDMYPNRYAFIGVLILGFILFAAGMVYLCWSAGRSGSGAVQPGGLNKLPLDLYFLLISGGIAGLILLFNRLTNWMENEGPHPGNLSLIGMVLIVISMLGISIIVAFAAQLKMKDGYWWRHTVIGWCLSKLAQGIILLWKGCRSVLALLPVIWRWLTCGLAMALITSVLFVLAQNGSWIFILLLLLDLLFCIGIVFYWGYALGCLIRGIKQMCQGDLKHQISIKYLQGSFLELATHLNSLSETAMIAAENQTKSERMKSELITNISHDIKTPLTSIINFVDLLQRKPSPQESEEYLQILSRQSARMKKLIDDLMELSKANTGNITVHITRIDAAESINQALGEFSDKLDSVHLAPVFRQPKKPVMIQADGRLVWRVLSNILSNAVKYAMPGTRLYIDLVQAENQVFLSLKNISREEQLINADELMERFVRGDASRNSEGSGLGLNIAKSLMEIQNGQLQLLLDGDLFKVTLVFPAG